MAQQDDEEEHDDTEDLQQKMINANFKFENELLIEREQNINLIESNVLDVNEMMNNLSSLLSAQGESVQTIADVIEEGTSQVSSIRRVLIQHTCANLFKFPFRLQKVRVNLKRLPAVKIVSAKKSYSSCYLQSSLHLLSSFLFIPNSKSERGEMHCIS